MPANTRSVAILQEAIETGEILTIVYDGGEQPGTTRMIAPVMLVGEWKVKARCISSKEIKTYNINSMKFVSPDDGYPKYDPNFADQNSIRITVTGEESSGNKPYLLIFFIVAVLLTLLGIGMTH